MTAMTALLISIVVYGAVCGAVGYWLGEQTSLRVVGYGSESPFSTIRHWFSAWFPNTYYRLTHRKAR